MERDWWLSTPRMTIWVLTRDEKIVGAAPIARRFLGQPLANLIRWLRGQGGEFRMEEL